MEAAQSYGLEEQTTRVQNVMDSHLTPAESFIAFGLLQDKGVDDIATMLSLAYGSGPSSDCIRLAHRPHVMQLLSEFIWRDSIDHMELTRKLSGVLTTKRLRILPLIEKRFSIDEIARKERVNYESIRVRISRSIALLRDSDDPLLSRYGQFIGSIHANRPLKLPA